MISIKDIAFGYSAKTIIAGFSEIFREKSITALMGVSGCGKSTLMRVMAGLEQPLKGHVAYSAAEGQPRQLFYCFQDFDAFPWLTVEQNVELVQRFSNRQNSSAQEVIRRVGLFSHQSKYPRELSGGMRKRLAFARAIASGANFILLDEPFASLDVVAKSQLYSLIESEQLESGTAFVVVTHSIEEAIRLADRVIVCDGPPLKKVADITVNIGRPRTDLAQLDSEFSSTFSRINAAFLAIERSHNSSI